MTNNKKLIYKDKSANIQHLPYYTPTILNKICVPYSSLVHIYLHMSQQRQKLTYIKILQHLSHFMGKFIQTVLKVKQI